MSSLSNLYKGAYVKEDDNEPMVIDYSELFEKRLEENRQKEFLRESRRAAQTDDQDFEAGGFEGIDPDMLEQLTADQATLGAGVDEGSYSVAQDSDPGAAADEIIAQAQAQAEEIITNAQNEAQELKANAVNQGHDEGYSAGYQEAMMQKTAIEAEFAQKARELEEEYQRRLDEAEPGMVEALTRVYEHVFSVQLRDDKNIILHLLKQALGRAEPTGDFLIHASSADYDILVDAREELKESISNPNCTLEIIEDSFLKENECMIETDGGVFDCGLGTELQELSRKLRLLSLG
ncbi:MAG: hypothetical protein K6C95_09685 [Lachnospiraceae bacterium]|nr:hypothetical protein [Lachnospiraceae bacterium]